MKKAKLWSVVRISHPAHPGITVRIGEYLKPGGILQVYRWVNGKQMCRSLKCRRADLGSTPATQVKEARRIGAQFIEELMTAPRPEVRGPAAAPMTLTQLADQYEERGFFGRGDRYARQQLASIRRIAAFLQDRPVAEIKPSHLAEYREARLREGVTHAVKADLRALSIACNWGIGEGLLIGSNPLTSKRAKDAMKIEHEPSRPVITPERFQKLQAVAASVPPAFGVILALAWHTGHRISAILGLRWRDVTLTATPSAPHGAITWYAGQRADNKKHTHVVAVNSEAAAALVQWKKTTGGIAGAFLFPDPKDAAKPLSHWAAKRWLLQAERRAGLDHVTQSGWHALRRAWATQRKHLPIQDVAVAGGWKDTQVPLTIYQRATEQDTRRAATHVA